MFIHLVLTIENKSENKVNFILNNIGKVSYIENYIPCSCGTFYVRPLIAECNKRTTVLKVVSSRRIIETKTFTTDNNCKDIENTLNLIADYLNSLPSEIHHLFSKSIQYFNNDLDQDEQRSNTCRCHSCTKDTE